MIDPQFLHPGIIVSTNNQEELDELIEAMKAAGFLIPGSSSVRRFSHESNCRRLHRDSYGTLCCSRGSISLYRNSVEYSSYQIMDFSEILIDVSLKDFDSMFDSMF